MAVSRWLRSEAERWITDDPDPQTRRELTSLFTAAAEDPAAAAELADRFHGPLAFGTAGLRGEMAAGPNRMNRAVVVRAAAGLAGYLNGAPARRASGRAEPAGKTVVIGYDARHNSHTFAMDTAEVVRGAGLDAVVLQVRCPHLCSPSRSDVSDASPASW